jgi:ABC-type dipeptide/oligopeptide/nickel transport system permease subunit
VVVFALFLAMAFFPQIFTQFEPNRMNSAVRMISPTASHIFGTDQFGRDIYSRVVHGVRETLSIAFLSIVLACVLGTALGVISGFYGRWIDQIVMRLMDAMFAFPTIILALFIIALYGASQKNLIIALGIVYTPIFTRTVRGSTISIKQFLYIKAAKALGKRDLSIMLKDVLPNLTSVLIVSFTTNFSTAVLSEASLSFLGLGVPPPTPTLGGMVGQGSNFLLSAPWIALFPGLFIALIVLSINIIGDGLRDVLDPRY